MNASTIIQATTLLKAGKLVAFPTETVYGLGADAANPEAVKKIFAAKGRPADHPVIVHLANLQQLEQWAQNIPAIAWQLAEKYWPGPLTLILKRAARVSNFITGGQETVGIRIPAHPIAQALLTQFGGGIAAPSANRFGHVSPTHAEHVKQELGDSVDLILDGGACAVGIESTIIDVSSDIPRLLRPGSILASQLNAILGVKNLMSANNTQHNNAENTPRASGMLESHYAPTTPLKIIDETKLLIKLKKLAQQGKKVFVITYSITPNAEFENIYWLQMPKTPQEYAHDLYATMRIADNKNVDIILVESIPNNEEWMAIADRLYKAAAK